MTGGISPRWSGPQSYLCRVTFCLIWPHSKARIRQGPCQLMGRIHSLSSIDAMLEGISSSSRSRYRHGYCRHVRGHEASTNGGSGPSCRQATSRHIFAIFSSKQTPRNCYTCTLQRKVHAKKYRGLLIVATQKTKSAIAVFSLFLLLHNNYWASEKVCISLSLLFLSKSTSSHVEGSGTCEVDPKDHADESEPRMASSLVQTDSLPIVLGTEDLLPMPLPLHGPERVNQTIVPGFPPPFWISAPRLHARCKCPAL
jgi:hypothetical protein